LDEPPPLRRWPVVVEVVDELGDVVVVVVGGVVVVVVGGGPLDTTMSTELPGRTWAPALGVEAMICPAGAFDVWLVMFPTTRFARARTLPA
jgi:hypothetical protein